MWYISKNPKKIDDFPFQTPRDFFPKIMKDEPAFDENLKDLTFSFLKQSVLKQLLTEGDLSFYYTTQ